MSPLETYAEAKRSGTHPDTLENWPDKPEEIPVHTPIGPTPEPIKPLDVEIKSPWYFSPAIEIIHLIITLTLVFAVLWLFQYDKDINGTAQLLKEAPPKVSETKRIYKTKHSVRYKTKVKRVYVAKNSGKWRKRYCYETGNWDACLAYKTNLPLRARIGRTDLF
jgi:hypothetical protein